MSVELYCSNCGEVFNACVYEEDILKKELGCYSCSETIPLDTEEKLVYAIEKCSFSMEDSDSKARTKQIETLNNLVASLILGDNKDPEVKEPARPYKKLPLVTDTLKKSQERKDNKKTKISIKEVSGLSEDVPLNRRLPFYSRSELESLVLQLIDENTKKNNKVSNLAKAVLNRNSEVLRLKERNKELRIRL